MRLLLVGFSEQNASVIAIFCKKHFEQLECERVKRQLTDNLHLRLPHLTIAEKAADAFMIYLDGVGMSTYKSEYQQTLLEFLEGKPCILTSRRDAEKWRSSQFLANDQVLFLDFPYSQDAVHEKLEALSKILVNNKNRINKPTVYPNTDRSQRGIDTHKADMLRDTTQIASQKTPSVFAHESNLANHKTTASRSIKPSQVIDGASSIEDVYDALRNNDFIKEFDRAIERYYPFLFKISLTKNALVMLAQTEPLKLTVGAHFLLIDPVELKVVLNKEVSRVVEYMSTAGKFLPSAATSLDMKVISKSEFLSLSEKLIEDGDHQNYSLNTLLWEVSQSVISEQFDYHEHALKMKVKFMPNLSVIPNTPHYIYPVLSACLLTPRSISELETMFPDLDVKTLNRLMAIAMLSGILDGAYLFKDIDEVEREEATTTTQVKEVPEVNKSIQKARKNGFFQRLLDKLTI